MIYAIFVKLDETGWRYEGMTHDAKQLGLIVRNIEKDIQATKDITDGIKTVDYKIVELD